MDGDGAEAMRVNTAMVGVWTLSGTTVYDDLGQFNGDRPKPFLLIPSMAATASFGQNVIIDATLPSIMLSWSLHMHLSVLSLAKAYISILPLEWRMTVAGGGEATASPSSEYIMTPLPPNGHEDTKPFALAMRVLRIEAEAQASVKTNMLIALDNMDVSVDLTKHVPHIHASVKAASWTVSNQKILGLENICVAEGRPALSERSRALFADTANPTKVVPALLRAM